MSGCREANRCKHRLRVAHHVGGPEAKHAEAASPQPCITTTIARGVVTHIVAVAVNFDVQTRRRAVEVEHAAADRMLVPEFQTIRPPT